METVSETVTARLGDNLYVTDVFESINKCNFAIGAEKATSLKEKQIEWLKKNVEGIKILNVRVTIEEIEEVEGN